MREICVPVLIVGGGGCGLASSIFLSRLGIESLLVEKHITQSPMPKARGLNRRTIEIFRQYGFADAVLAKGIPATHLRSIRYATSLGGDGIHDRKTLFEMNGFREETIKDLLDASPVPGTSLPQVRLEPLMREYAESLNVGKLEFGTEFLHLSQNESEVVATLQNRHTGENFVVRCQYLIAADAGKTVGPNVGNRFEGTGELAEMVTIYFKADLSEYIDSDYLVSYWFANPDGDPSSWGSGVLGKLGPNNFGRDSEEWMFHFNTEKVDGKLPDTATLIDQVRDLLKIPGLQMEVLGTSLWVVAGQLADRYNFGRVFLAGDAAHRHTPTTGLGLNSAVHDAHNLCWKIAAILKKQAHPKLLDTYESERRPVAKRNVDWALFTWSNHAQTAAAIGLDPADPARSRANFEALLAPGFDGEARRARFRDAMQTHRTEWQAADLDLGFVYSEGALVPDGTAAPDSDPYGHLYQPSARPGSRLPHSWLELGVGTVSSLDAIKPDSYTLFITADEERWKAAILVADSQRFPVNVVSLDETADPDGKFRALCKLEAGGALLVRPDQHVAWRSCSEPEDIGATFEDILGRLACPTVDLIAQRASVKPALNYATYETI